MKLQDLISKLSLKVLTNLEDKDILFIDEIHRLSFLFLFLICFQM